MQSSRADSTGDSRARLLPDSMSNSRARPRWKKLAELLAMPGLVLGAAALSCVTDSANTVMCESGLICPAGWICVIGDEACMPKDCGNGVVDRSNGEVCDDGNFEPGDGCSASCLSSEVCGNGIRDEGEACDDGNTESNDGCRGDCLLLESCDDGKVDPGEVCDDGNRNDGDGCSANCLHLEMCLNMHVDPREYCDHGGNTAACDSDCTEPKCGDGHHNPEHIDRFTGIQEQCDHGGFSETCDDDCTWAKCGDRVVNPMLISRDLDEDTPGGDAGEECDDGNKDDNDECLSTCQWNTCGDGHPRRNVEGCDDGNGVLTDNCPDGPGGTCQPARCGDGIKRESGDKDEREECDEGGDTEECDADCTEPRCGDRYVNTAIEQCDDGNGLNNDNCPDGEDGTCQWARCGDGHAYLPIEQCDPGNNQDTDRCDFDCTFSECGDRHVNTIAGEECDDGGAIDTTGCDGDCTYVVCGDRYINEAAGEECDDGNTSNNDSCLHNGPTGECKRAFCGDGFIRTGVEQCESDADCGEFGHCTEQCMCEG